MTEEEKKIEIPVAVAADLLKAAANGLAAEDPHNTLAMDKEEWLFLDRLLVRALYHHPEDAVKKHVLNTMAELFAQIEPEGLHDADPG